MTCETSNNTNIEVQTARNFGFSEDIARLDKLLTSEKIKKKVKNIKEIIGERTTSGLSSNLISPEESKNTNYAQPGAHSVLDREKLGPAPEGIDNIVVTATGVQSHSNTMTTTRPVVQDGNPYLRRGFKGVGKKPGSAKRSAKKVGVGGNKLANSIAKVAEKMTPKKPNSPLLSRKASSDEEVDEIGQASQSVMFLQNMKETSN